MTFWSEFPVLNSLINEVPAPRYGSRPLDGSQLTRDGMSRAKYHANSASVKQMAPVTYLLRGNASKLLDFGRNAAIDQFQRGHYNQPQAIGTHYKLLSSFYPQDKDMTLMHAGETGVVMSSYVHTVYPMTRLAQYSKIFNLGNNQYYPMTNILSLPEDTTSFNAKLRYQHKSNSGAIKNPGEFRTMSLRCDLKLRVWIPIDPSRPMDEGNRRLQTLLPIEYKRHHTFSRGDLEMSTLCHTDHRVPSDVRQYVVYGDIIGGFASPPPPPRQNVWFPDPPVEGASRIPVLVGLGEGEQSEDGEENDLVGQNILEGLRYHGGHAEIMRDQEVDHRVHPGANVPPPKAVIASNVRQMSAYSASDVTRWAALMNGDTQMFVEFPKMVQQMTPAEQWDEGVGDCAVICDNWESGQWLVGLFAQLVWCWLWFMFRA